MNTGPVAAEAASLRAMSTDAREDNRKEVADLPVSDEHKAMHIRGLVAATMAHLAADVTATTRDNAAQWQGWALALADDYASAQDAGEVHPQ
jgi:hypothetical protein